MTIVKPIQIECANQAFAAWDQLGVSGRAERLEQAIAALNAEQSQMARWQLTNAQHELGEALVLPGPTGESNVLSCHGRGVFLVTQQADLASEQVSIALTGQLFAALVAGNTVITVGAIGQCLMDNIAPYVPDGVIQNVAQSAEDSVIEANDLAGVAVVCQEDYTQQLNQRLAEKPGLLCQLVAETNWETLTYITTPHYILRFITEQTITTNTTAIGGNATLLALGSKTE